MSKSMIAGFAKAQYKALNAKDNKERLKYTIAGIRDGHLYDHNGTDYGLFDAECPNTEFIPASDLELSRITGSKILGITEKMDKFFDNYFNGTEEGAINIEDEATLEEEAEEVDEKPKKPKKEKKADEPEEAIDIEAVTSAFKKALKKGNIKKATKLVKKLPDCKDTDKLIKKLNNA